MVKRGLFIGCNYENTPNRLFGCKNDVLNVKKLLIKSFHYKEENTQLLTDDTLHKPTRRNIEDSIKWLVRDALPGDVLFFYYSGHGSYIPDTTQDESDGNDEVLVPLDFRTAGFINDDWIYDNLTSKVPRGVTLWAFGDCCHSGTLFDLKYNFKSQCTLKRGLSINRINTYRENDWIVRFSQSQERSMDVIGNCFYFSGCLDRGVSADAFINKQPQGAFTYCLLKFINQNIFSLNTKTLQDMLKEVNCLLIINRFSQVTQLSSSFTNALTMNFSI
jgi:hypothetical protein